jgi:phytoene dehydrogenase-like protein
MIECDAVVVGAGPNGLVAANALADAGWDVVLVEAQEEVGGAVRSAEVVSPGFVTDLFSAFYPLAAASPVIRDLHLEHHGLVWRRAPDVLAHALPDGRAAVLRGSAEDTASGLEACAAGDGEAWMRMVSGWERIRDPLLDALFTPFPPVRPMARLLRRWGAAGTLEFTRLALLSVRRLGEEEFSSEEARVLLAGNAMHSDLPPDGAGSALFGWLLAMLGQDVGFPVPQGGAGMLATALRRRAESLGVQVRCGVAVRTVEVVGGRARGVRLADGERIGARHGILADVPAPTLYGSMVAAGHLPARVVDDALRRFEWDDATLKVNWALDAPIPWAAPGARSAGTVHLGVDHDGLVDVAADLSVGRMPGTPFVLLGQMSVADPLRSPAGTESAWAYTHFPRSAAPTRAPSTRRPNASRMPWSRLLPGSAPCVAHARSRPRPTSRTPTATSASVLSTRGRLRCTSSWCCGRPPVSDAPRPPCPGCSSPAPRPIREEASTERAGGTPQSRHCAIAARRAPCGGLWCALPGRGCCARRPCEGQPPLVLSR